jgi:hypothetical protein
MADQSEAAALIQSGAAYGRRVGWRSDSGATVFTGFKPGGFSLYFDDSPFFHTDLEGRWQRALIDGVHFLKGLDAGVVSIDRIREGENLVLHRRSLPFAEANDLDATVRAAALELIERIQRGSLSRIEPAESGVALATGDLLEMLDRIGAWDASAWFRHRERYLGTYGPLPFLPAEAQQAVVLQATLGHPGPVAFGGAEPREHYVRSPEEFAQHVRDVSALLGRRVAQCRSVFLAGADVLHQPSHVVGAYLDIAGQAFRVDSNAPRLRMKDWKEEHHRLDGILTLMDDFQPNLPRLSDWRRFRERDLLRVGLGVESGDPRIRALYGKSWPDQALGDLVADIKEAGISVSLLILSGAGGIENAERHLTATGNLVGSLDLGVGDHVYLLDDHEVGGASARDRLMSQGHTPFSPDAMEKRRRGLKSALTERLGPKRVKILTYLLEKQWA